MNKRFSNLILILSFATLTVCSTSCGGQTKSATQAKPATEEVFDISREEMVTRDPYVFVDPVSKYYYMPVSDGDQAKTITCYKSKDLQNWKKESTAFTAAPDFWGQRDFWAPDMFFYKGKYYILATFSNEGAKRGTSFLVADRPEGPYQPLCNQPITPADWTCLDATLYIDEENTPWLLYSREWVEVENGQIIIQQLAEDLTKTVGEPRILFSAADAPWVKSIKGDYDGKVFDGYVTDAPILYRANDGSLLLFWSSFNKEGQYAMGVARSDNGKITGKWIHDKESLNHDDGGHCMIFRDLNNELKISYHAPNSHPSRPQLHSLECLNGTVTLKD